MPISIECESCHSVYNVGDALAGKKVKCRGCGNAIAVPNQGAMGGRVRECLSCGQTMPMGARICSTCGFNPVTGQKEATLLDPAVLAGPRRRKEKARPREGENLAMAAVDTFFKYTVLVLGVIGVVAALARVMLHPGAFSPYYLLPILLVPLLLAGVVAPVTALLINLTVYAMKRPTRHDAYSRVATALLLPFLASAITGWPEFTHWGWIAWLAWPAAAGLLIYYFRAGVGEWIASLMAAAAGLAIGAAGSMGLGFAINAVGAPLYADMFPAGPWTMLANGNGANLPATDNGVQPSSGTGSLANAGVRSGSPAGVSPGTTSGTTPPTTAMQPTPTVVTPPAPGPATEPPRASTKLASPMLMAIKTDERFNGVNGIISPAAPGGHFLVTRDSETMTTVERWSNVGTMVKKESESYPLFPRKPAQFALSPRGVQMVALQFFPRNQIEVTNFDTVTKKTIVPAEQQAMPTLLGFVDEKSFCLRWENNGVTFMQVVEGATGNEVMHTPPETIDPQAAATVLSPDGKLLAAFGHGEILIYTLEPNKPARHIRVSELPVKLFGMAFSPDSARIAMYAAIDGLPTLAAFRTANGEMAYTRLLSPNPVASDFNPLPHALVWLPTTGAWLINGSEIVDPNVAKPLAVLAPPPLMDVNLAGPNLMAFILRGDAPTVTFAQPNDVELKKAH